MTSKALEPVPWLRPLSWVYRLGVAARNATIDLGMRRVERLPVPVVSIGNLSVGGTGKTPFVILLVQRLRAAGYRPGVLARGYGRKPGEALNDEGRLLAMRFPGLPQAQSPRRADAGRQLLAAHAVDVLLLDDGFQHRMLHRDIDVCLLDASRPFGGGLLPAGYGREPRSALQRADVCVLSNSDSLPQGELVERREEIIGISGGKPCFATRTVVRDVVEMPGHTTHEKSVLADRAVSVVAGIAQPERFVRSLEDQGARVVAKHFVRDHAEIAPDLLERVARQAEAAGSMLVITEKDEARLAIDEGVLRWVLRIETQFVDAGPFEDPGLTPFLPNLIARREG